MELIGSQLPIAWRKISPCFSRLPTPVHELLRNFSHLVDVENIKSIRILERDCKTLTDYFNLMQNVRGLSSGQIKEEILCLLEKASRSGLRFVTEIGTGAGGTFYLLCKVARADATIITLDVNMPLWRKRLLKSCVQPGQKATIMEADSHRKNTVRHVTELLAGNKLDLLFIDGDHTYEGVGQDFLNYSPLVRKGGWIAFHDIIPDYKTRYGISTKAWVGGVPRFWNQVKHDHDYFEIVKDPDQDGFGIGVLIWKQS